LRLSVIKAVNKIKHSRWGLGYSAWPFLPGWVGAMSTGESWDVNEHIARCSSPVSLVSQCKLRAKNRDQPRPISLMARERLYVHVMYPQRTKPALYRSCQGTLYNATKVVKRRYLKTLRDGHSFHLGLLHSYSFIRYFLKPPVLNSLELKY